MSTIYPIHGISIHALLAESDLAVTDFRKRNVRFLSTLSLRRATTSQVPTWFGIPNFYPRSPCGERRSNHGKRGTAKSISIHALLAESDRGPGGQNAVILDFYPRSPCGERRSHSADVACGDRFLSTLSLRRATSDAFAAVSTLLISIHALLAESDFGPILVGFIGGLFLSTLSLRRATYDTYAKVLRVNISIHALLAESDLTMFYRIPEDHNFYPRSPCGERQYHRILLRRSADYFYPRSPCGERRRLMSFWLFGRLFLSTLSLRRATVFSFCLSVFDFLFLSTLSLRRATKILPACCIHLLYFYPRSPCGERHGGFHKINCQLMVFLSTLSLRRATGTSYSRKNPLRNFYPRSPCGERRRPICKYGLPLIFLSTLSLRRATIAWSPDRQARAFLSTLSLRRATLEVLYADGPTMQFLSTLSLRRATCCRQQGRRRIVISIHALLAESDAPNKYDGGPGGYFYPRSPCGERLPAPAPTQPPTTISIHALLAESDSLWVVVVRRFHDFYPRSPCGERPLPRFLPGSGFPISIHALLAESDSKSAQNSGALLRI